LTPRHSLRDTTAPTPTDSVSEADVLDQEEQVEDVEQSHFVNDPVESLDKLNV
jgi:hypothetical protein